MNATPGLKMAANAAIISAVKKLIDYFRNLGTLGMTLAVSIALHGALLLVRFVDPERFDKVFDDTPLEVVLVNARSEKAPDKAQAIAQHNLEGGGESNKKVLASSPAPMSSLTDWGEDMEEQERKTAELLEEQIQVLTQARQELAKVRQYTPQEIASNPAAAAEEEKRRALLEQLGEIERRINEENSRPKKRFISPATKAGSHALYYAQFKDKVEELGTTNFPQIAGRRLYGELTMIITIDERGRVLQTEVMDSSGDKGLDRIAQAIVRAGAPYGDFTPDMTRDYRILVIASRFKFTREEGLETSTQDLSQTRQSDQP